MKKIIFLFFVFSQFLFSQNPFLLKQINQTGAAAGTSGLNKKIYKLNNTTAVFFANDGIHGKCLWATDGTNIGTQLLFDPVDGVDNFYVENALQAEDLFYFVITFSNPFNRKVYRSDGTSAGTVLMMDTNAISNINLYPGNNYYTTIGRKFYACGTLSNQPKIFAFDDGTIDWTIYNFTQLQSISYICGVANQMYIYADLKNFEQSNIEFGTELCYGGDGLGSYIYGLPDLSFTTTPGTTTPNFSLGSEISQMVNVNNQYLLFSATTNPGTTSASRLYRITPNQSDLTYLADLSNVNFYSNGVYDITRANIIGNKIFFKANNSSNASVYVSDGTINGTFNVNLSGIIDTPVKFGNKCLIIKPSGGQTLKYLWDGLSPNSYNENNSFSTNEFVSDAIELNGKVFVSTTNIYESGFMECDLNGENCSKIAFTDIISEFIPFNNKLVCWSNFSNQLNYIDIGSQLMVINTDYKLWKGTIDNDFHNPQNWSPTGIPSQNNDVFIPLKMNNPVMNNSATVRNLYINEGSLTINEDVDLTVLGDLSVCSRYGSPRISGLGTITRTGSYSNKSYGKGVIDVSKINIDGSDIEYLVESGTSSIVNFNQYIYNDVSVKSVFNFVTNNKVVLNNTSLSLSKYPFYEGVNSQRYFVTNKNGFLWIGGMDAFNLGQVLFPIGSSVNDDYTPFIANVDSFNPINMYAQVKDGVKVNGDSGISVNNNVVNKTWLLYRGGDQNVYLKFFWNPFNELAGFNHDEATISHYVNNQWTLGITSNAIFQDNQYSIFQNGYTSFGPFSVTSANFLLTQNFKDIKSIKVFPNPTSSTLNLQFINNTTVNKLVITDLTGKIVLVQNNTNQINVANLANGIYVVEAFLGDEKFVNKFIKE